MDPDHGPRPWTGRVGKEDERQERSEEKKVNGGWGRRGGMWKKEEVREKGGRERDKLMGKKSEGSVEK